MTEFLSTKLKTTCLAIASLLFLLLLVSFSDAGQTNFHQSDQGSQAKDPGVREELSGTGSPLSNLTSTELEMFNAGKDDFEEAEGVAKGLGPRFNLDSCGGCHAEPSLGGTSPAVNPQVAVATAFGANNIVPFFVDRNGPIREA